MLLDATPGLPMHNAQAPARALEALLLKQVLAQALPRGTGSGAGLHADLFADALASAVAEAGGLGLAEMLLPRDTASAAPACAPVSNQADALQLASAVVGSPSRISSPFGARRDPFDATPSFHAGIDIAAEKGAPIRAIQSGVVRSAGERGGYGQAVELVHADGSTTLYAHAQRLTVRPGDVVQRGQIIGEIGETGRATGPHLHFELRRGGRPLNPASALKAYGVHADEVAERALPGPPGQTSRAGEAGGSIASELPPEPG